MAYRSLARPSSVLEPSHSLDGIATPKDNRFTESHLFSQLTTLILLLACTVYIPIQRPEQNSFTQPHRPQTGMKTIYYYDPLFMDINPSHQELLIGGASII